MHIGISVIITLIAAILSWQLPNFIWRLIAVSLSAFISANLAYVFMLWLYPDSELSSWQGIIIDTSFKVSLGVGLYVVLMIQIIKKAGVSKNAT
jgi:hypothetical protein